MKRIVAILLSLCLMLSVCACAKTSSESSKDEKEQFAEEAVVELDAQRELRADLPFSDLKHDWDSSFNIPIEDLKEMYPEIDFYISYDRLIESVYASFIDTECLGIKSRTYDSRVTQGLDFDINLRTGENILFAGRWQSPLGETTASANILDANSNLMYVSGYIQSIDIEDTFEPGVVKSGYVNNADYVFEFLDYLLLVENYEIVGSIPYYKASSPLVDGVNPVYVEAMIYASGMMLEGMTIYTDYVDADNYDSKTEIAIDYYAEGSFRELPSYLEKMLSEDCTEHSEDVFETSFLLGEYEPIYMNEFAVKTSDGYIGIGDTMGELMAAADEFDIGDRLFWNAEKDFGYWDVYEDGMEIGVGQGVHIAMRSLEHPENQYIILSYNPIGHPVPLDECKIGTIILSGTTEFGHGVVKDLKPWESCSMLGFFCDYFSEGQYKFYSWDLDPIVVNLGMNDFQTYKVVCVQHKDNPQTLYDMTPDLIALMDGYFE